MQKKIKVGFDLDGVLLYNPARIVRPLISTLKKKKLVAREELEFYVPQKKKEKIMWRVFHWSSFMPNIGFNKVQEMVQEGLIEAYIITARYSHLKKDFNFWYKILNKNNIFTQAFINEKDEQPHLFKQRMLKELELDYFVEDNWDIVNYLTCFNSPECASEKVSTKVYWVYNLLDKKIKYPHKVPHLKGAAEAIENDIWTNRKLKKLIK